MDCVFCKIAQGEIDSDILYEDEDLIAFRDAEPQAPVHFLVVPKEHISSTNALKPEHKELIGKIFLTIRDLAKKEGIDEKGYRIVNNIGEEGGQSVKHIHFHVLGGRSMQWPPG